MQEVAVVLQEVDYSVDPMLMPPAAVVHPYLLHFDFPIRLVAGPDFVIPTRQAVVEQSLALPSLQLVAVEQDFAYPAQQVVVEQGLAIPNLPRAAVPTAPTHYRAVAPTASSPRDFPAALVAAKSFVSRMMEGIGKH